MNSVRSLKLAGMLFSVSTLFGSPVLQAQEASLETLEERAGYTLGINVGSGLKSQGFADHINVDRLMTGIRDALADDPQLSDNEMMAVIQEFTMQQQERQQAEQAVHAEEQKQFLVDNAERDGVVTTDSGLQYLVLEEGEADAASPGATDTVNVHYHGTLTDGTVFDSSVDRGSPMDLQLNRVIAGWTEGIQLMQVGDRYRFFIPAELGYGGSGAGQLIGPNTTLIFDVELLGIKSDGAE